MSTPVSIRVATWRMASGVTFEVRKPSVSVMMPVSSAAAMGW